MIDNRYDIDTIPRHQYSIHYVYDSISNNPFLDYGTLSVQSYSCKVNSTTSVQFQFNALADPAVGYGEGGRGAEKHVIDVAAFGGHLFYDLFLQGPGGSWPPRSPGSTTAMA